MSKQHPDSQVPSVPAQGSQPWHEPILVHEIISHFKLKPNATVVDATLGLGGHSAAILAQFPDAQIVGLDRDPGALKLAQNRLAEHGPRFTTLHASFADMATALPATMVGRVSAVLMDLGISSWQLAERGFSFLTEAPLDFRMDPREEVTAADLVNQTGETELADLIYRYGEENASRRIAAAIVAARREKTIATTTELASIIEAALGRRGARHPATKTFQALRIAVNDELGSLERGLDAAVTALAPGGTLAVITFHSLEDRIVKNYVRSTDSLDPVNKKVIRPERAEILRNSRSRSAKLRLATKVG